MAQPELRLDANRGMGAPPEGTVGWDPEEDDAHGPALDLELEFARIRLGTDGGPHCD
jgi:hypothetical protein